MPFDSDNKIKFLCLWHHIINFTRVFILSFPLKLKIEPHSTFTCGIIRMAIYF
jgi:hypothetical protein